MNEIQVFSFEKQPIRTVVIGNEPWWVLKDVCDVLEASNSRMVADRLDEDEVSQTYVTDSLGRQQETTIINESGLYNVLLRSDKPKAKPFRKWVTSKVLPTIRKTGTYSIDTTKLSLAEAKLLNAKARVSSQWMKLSGAVNSAEYRQICAHYASAVLVGKPVIPLPESTENHMSAKELGELFGISAQKVGMLANANHLKTEEFGKWYRDKSRYSNKEVDTFKYNHKAVERLKTLLGREDHAS